MKCEAFVEKVYNDWLYKTINNMISMVENFGIAEEIAVLIEYTLDEKVW